jgi:nuclear GTP-binding protein
VLDARDPNGTRCRHLEQHLKKNAKHKHLLLLLNKCDLVGWVEWRGTRSRTAEWQNTGQRSAIEFCPSCLKSWALMS